jgi:hypothetical protein
MRKLALMFLIFACVTLADTTEIAFFRGVLSPANEVPAANFPGGGTATCITYITRDSSGKIISGSVDFIVGVFAGAPTGLTGLHIHKGAAGANGPITIATDLGRGGATPAQPGINLISKQANAVPGDQAALDTLNDLLQDPTQYYVNVHTTDFPGRGDASATQSRGVFCSDRADDHGESGTTGSRELGIGSRRVDLRRGARSQRETDLGPHYSGFGLQLRQTDHDHGIPSP